MNEVIAPAPLRAGTVARATTVVPAAIAGAGEHATRRFLEFFAATIRNRNTRMAYYRACCSFFAWLDINAVTELADIEPIHVAAYIEALQTTNAKPTVKQHLAAVRMLFDYSSSARSSPSTRRTPCAGQSTSSSAARRRCWSPTMHARCSTAFP